MTNCGRVGCCGNLPPNAPPVDSIVQWSEHALARREACDVPYARRSVGVVLGLYNGGWAVKVLWPFGERVHDISDVRVMEGGA